MADPEPSLYDLTQALSEAYSRDINAWVKRVSKKTRAKYQIQVDQAERLLWDALRSKGLIPLFEGQAIVLRRASAQTLVIVATSDNDGNPELTLIYELAVEVIS